jgi:hypothetical protein
MELDSPSIQVKHRGRAIVERMKEHRYHGAIFSDMIIKKGENLEKTHLRMTLQAVAGSRMHNMIGYGALGRTIYLDVPLAPNSQSLNARDVSDEGGRLQLAFGEIH